MNAQNTFNFTIKDTISDRLINDAVELSTGGYILLSDEVHTGNPSKTQLIRISTTGNLLGMKEIPVGNVRTCFMKIVQVNPNLFVLAGYQGNWDSTFLWVYKMDSLFNEVQSKVFSFDNYIRYTVSDLIMNNDNIICSGIAWNTNQLPYAFIYKISSSFDSLQLRIFTEHPTQFPTDLMVKKNNKGYYCFITGFGPPAAEDIVELDTVFSIQSIKGVPDDVFQNPEAKWISDKFYILTGNKNYLNDPNNRCIGILCLDTLVNVVYDYYIGDHDTIEWPGLSSRLDFIDTNRIYVGGTHNMCISSEFCPVYCWFSLNQMDTTLHVNWQYFYGGDANYTLYGIRATQDGGCLLFGSRYDLNATNLERDIYVFKVNSDGRIFPTGINSPLIHEAIIYPNPGSNYLIIESGPQISGSEFSMISMNGKNVISKLITSSKMKFETESLPTGIYVWQITNRNKVIESGKWIKE